MGLVRPVTVESPVAKCYLPAWSVWSGLVSPVMVRVYGTMLCHCTNLQVVVYTTVDMPLILTTSYDTPFP